MEYIFLLFGGGVFFCFGWLLLLFLISYRENIVQHHFYWARKNIKLPPLHPPFHNKQL